MDERIERLLDEMIDPRTSPSRVSQIESLIQKLQNIDN